MKAKLKYLAAAGLSAIMLAACGPENKPIEMPPEKQEADQESAMAEPSPLMRWSDLTGRPLPKPNDSITYGDNAAHLVDVWLPNGAGPHPVVLMIHGGCWQKSIADRTLMNYAAETLRQEGMAVWNIEYRGVDEPGGGYPGTFLDVVGAAKAFGEYADEFNLDTDRIAGFGHSAGGHLITWLAGVHNTPEGSPMAGISVPKMTGVINSGGLADLQASEPVTLESCLTAIKDDLIGAASEKRPDPLSDTSSDRLLPTGTQIISVNGARDQIAPPQLGQGFTAKALAAGDSAKTVIVDNEGHVELIAPGSAAFDEQIRLLKDILDIN